MGLLRGIFAVTLTADPRTGQKARGQEASSAAFGGVRRDTTTAGEQ